MTKRGRIVRGVVLIFSLCALGDFVLGYFHQRTISAGVVSVVGGLLSTAFYLLLMQPWKGKDESDATRR